MKKWRHFLLAGVLLLGVAGCSDSDTDYYAVDINTTGTGSGTVTGSGGRLDCPDGICSFPYREGTEVTLTATPDDESEFVGWTGGPCSGTGPCTFTVDGAMSVTANFDSDVETMLQLIHASDLEGGVNAIDNAPNFAAIIDALEEEYPNTLIISAGDNYIPGPFLSAAGDSSVRPVLRDVLDNPDAREGGGRIDIAIMNLIGFDASAFGNHEFDSGTSFIADVIGTDIRDGGEARWLGTQFPYLSANLDFSGDDNLSGLYTDQILPSDAFASPLADPDAAAAAPKIAPAAIVNLNGEQFGVVGATTPRLEEISSPGDTQVKNPGAGTSDMADLAAILQPVIDRLLARGIDKIILTTHLQQIALEQELIGRLRGVDIVIAGGSDTLLADSTDVLRPEDMAADSYPIVTTNADGDPAVIVSTDGEYSYVGRLVVAFDDEGTIKPDSLDPMESGVYAAMDSVVATLWGSSSAGFDEGTKGNAVRTLTDAVSQIVIQKDSQIFGETDVFLNGLREDVRTQETNLGNLTADANLAAARSVDPSVQVSIKNGGGIRDAIGTVVETSPGQYERVPPQPNPAANKAEGDVSRLDIENTLRFNNELTLLTLTAEELLQVMEHAVSATEPGTTPGQFPQVGGMAFSFDPNRPPGDRIVSLALRNENGNTVDVIAQNGELTGDPNRPVRVVTLNFLAGGGDGYPFDDLGDNVVETGIGEQSALSDYLADNFAADPYAVPDTPPEADQRIQNLAFRQDAVIGQPPAPPEIAGFEPLAHFPVPGGGVAEIVMVTPDGRTMFYTDADNGTVGVVDISDPAAPVQTGTVDVTDMPDHEPTSAAVSPDGRYLMVTVRQGDDADNAIPGLLRIYDITSPNSITGVADIPVGVGPDSIAVTETTFEGQTWTQAVISIEDEESVDGDATLGGMRPGRIDVIRLNPADPASSLVTSIQDDLVSALNSTAGVNYPDDPQPEYVSISPDGTEAVISLQENNAVALVNISNPNMPMLDRVFSTGTVTRNSSVDVTEDDEIALVEDMTGRREPDMVAYHPGGYLLTANEGDTGLDTFGDGIYSGGRGFTVFNRDGVVFFEAGAEMEEQAVIYGHYPENRSENRGIEVEAIISGQFGGTEFMFPASERGSFIQVYRADNPENPVPVQFLPTGMSPEGLATVTGRDDGIMLLISANEDDGTVNIWRAAEEMPQPPADEPMLMSTGTDLPWGALSGLTSDGTYLYTVPDNAFGRSRIYRINLTDLNSGQALIDQVTFLRDGDGNDLMVDPEGIAWTGSGFWLASEGSAIGENALYRLDAAGQVQETVAFPTTLSDTYGDPGSNGFEGVAVSGDGRYVYTALQRGFDRSDDFGRIMRYDTDSGEWITARYPFTVHSTDPEEYWTGLSGLVLLDDDRTLLVIERDKGLGGTAEIKRVYSVDVAGMTENMELNKVPVRDLRMSYNYLQEKIEGIALHQDDLWVINDNDGAGWTRLINTGMP